MNEHHFYEEVKPVKYTNFSDLPLVLNVEDIADTLAIGKNKAYTLSRRGGPLRLF